MKNETTLTIQLSPAVKAALEAEASVKNKSLEQAAVDVIDTFFAIHGVPEDGYDAWYRAKVEEGLEAARQGKFVSNEEVKRSLTARREWLLQQIAKQQ